MNLETIFSIVNTAVLPGWLALLILPNARMTKILVHQHWLPGSIALFYAALVVFHFSPSNFSDFSSLAGLQRLFANPVILLAGWSHYLCFDLVVGGWIAREAKLQGIPHSWLAPVLLFTFILGPIGWLGFICLRLIWAKRA